MATVSRRRPLSKKPRSSRDKMRSHRDRLRAQGLRPIQIWVPDTRSPRFAAEARRQSQLIAASPFEADDQAFVELHLFARRGMIRGDIWTVAGGPDYAGKPRPVVVLQSDRFETIPSATVCPLTTNPTDAPLARLMVVPTEDNGLRETSRIMVDKIATVHRSKLRARVGRLGDEDMLRLNRAVLVFLGLAD